MSEEEAIRWLTLLFSKAYRVKPCACDADWIALQENLANAVREAHARR